MNIQYHVITVAANIESLGEMRQEHGLTNFPFIQLHVTELADMRTEMCTSWAIMAVAIVYMHKFLCNIGLLLANNFASTHIILYTVAVNVACV